MPVWTSMFLRVDGEEIPDIQRFSYTSDVQQLGDPFAAEIPDPYGRWSATLYRGAKVEVYLQNPEVNEGRRTLKLTGRIRQVKQKMAKGTGRVIQVLGADLGYHLQKSCGQVYFNLQRCTYKELLEKVIDESWGFKGVRLENDTSRALKLGRQQRLLALTTNGLVPLQYIGIEPGQTIADVLRSVARFAGLLVNVSADGYLQCWAPNYAREALYGFHQHAAGTPAAERNNIEELEVVSDADEVATNVTCVGEVLMQDLTPNPNDAHPGKKRGFAKDDDVFGHSTLDFFQRYSFVDSEQTDSAAAKRAAIWQLRQKMYNSWSYNITVRGHHQGGAWYESDTLCTLEDSLNVNDMDPKDIKPIRGKCYVSSVSLSWDARIGSKTQLTIKPAGLLSAPPVVK